MIIFSQGVIRCHPFILKELQAVRDPDTARGLAEFERLLRGHVGFTLANAARAFFHGLTGGRLAKAPPGTARRYFQSTSRFSAAFALAADMALLTMGGTLKRRQKISGRMADILGNLYLISALLKRFDERDCICEELPLVEWGCEDCLAKIRESFDGFMRNLPFRPAAWLLRFMVFPLGRPFAGPKDSVGHRVAQILLEPSRIRNRLTEGIFLPAGPDEPLARLEDALARVVAAEPLEKRLRNAVKDGRLRKGTELEILEAALNAEIVTADEAKTLWLAMEARREAARVDDFPSLRAVEPEQSFRQG
jgi:acyl-CoA dehydrogenase